MQHDSPTVSPVVTGIEALGPGPREGRPKQRIEGLWCALSGQQGQPCELNIGQVEAVHRQMSNDIRAVGPSEFLHESEHPGRPGVVHRLAAQGVVHRHRRHR